MQWYLITPQDGVWISDGNRRFKIERTEVSLYAYKQGMTYIIPFNGGLYVMRRMPVGRAMVSPPKYADDYEAHNTSLFCCHDCGDWLDVGSSSGYGTFDGLCGNCI